LFICILHLYSLSGVGVIYTVAEIPSFYSQNIAQDAAGNLYSAMTEGAGSFYFLTWTKSTGNTTVKILPRIREASPNIQGLVRQAVNIAVDSSGNIYFVELGMIRLITKSTGIVTTVAGTLAMGFGGDGGSALLARLNPDFIALDASENLYMSEYSNNRVRMISKSTGIITTVAGTGGTSNSGDGGSATSAELGQPTGITVDSAGNIYVCVGLSDTGPRIRMVKKSTGIITTVAGGGGTNDQNEFRGSEGPATSATLTACRYMAVDSRRNLYFSDYDDMILMVKNTTGIITVAAGTGRSSVSAGDGGQAEQASFESTFGITIDASDQIYINDFGKIRSFLLPADTSHAYPTKAPTTMTRSPTRLLYLPSMRPINSPSSDALSAKPSRKPTVKPTKKPTTAKPSRKLTVKPTKKPTTAKPSRKLTVKPTKKPTAAKPSRKPAVRRTKKPTQKLRERPSRKPFTRKPSPQNPTTSPSMFTI
jgi:hypothetical protein